MVVIEGNYSLPDKMKVEVSKDEEEQKGDATDEKQGGEGGEKKAP